MNKERIGRVKGTPNKVTAKVKDAISTLIEDSLDGLKEDLQQLTPKDRLNVVTGLLRYVIPSLKASEVNLSTSEQIPSWVNDILNDNYKSDDNE